MLLQPPHGCYCSLAVAGWPVLLLGCCYSLLAAATASPQVQVGKVVRRYSHGQQGADRAPDVCEGGGRQVGDRGGGWEARGGGQGGGGEGSEGDDLQAGR